MDRRAGKASEKTLFALAERYGIQTSYTDMSGVQQRASSRVLREVLALWGIQVERGAQARQLLRAAETKHWKQVLPAVKVCWDHQPCAVEIRLPAELEQETISCRLMLEDGGCRNVHWNPERLRAGAARDVDGRSYVAFHLPVSPLPFGYHRLELLLRHRVYQCFLISAPVLSYSPPEGTKVWGLFLPLYAARSKQSWGAGNFGDWAALANFTAAQGGAVLGTLPLLAAFLEKSHFEPSPYNPVSRLFWNDFYLDVEKIPEFESCEPAQRLVRSASFQRQLTEIRAAELLDYQVQMTARRQVLELLALHFFKYGAPRRQKQFQKFLLHRPTTIDYAEFRAACEHSKVSWSRWEPRMRNGKLQPDDYDQSAKDYHLYAQWIAEEQVSSVAALARRKELRFYLDLPIGVHPGGYDMWRHKEVFAAGASVGAPPDPYFPKGQDWGFAPLHPEHIRTRDYRYFIDMLRFQMRHAGMLRIDHVLAMHRLYWIPSGFSASDGAYVRYPAEELYAILTLESHRNETVLVGEDLGTVPAEVHESMARHRLRQTYVLQYEQRPDPKRALSPAPRCSVASMNTHDMPPFAAHWAATDIQKRVDLKLLPRGKAREESYSRPQRHKALLSYLQGRKLLGPNYCDSRDVFQACLKWLGSSAAETVLVNIEDLWGELEWQNVPGTTAEHPNWCRKAKLTLEQIVSSSAIRESLQVLRKLRPARHAKKHLVSGRTKGKRPRRTTIH